MKLLIGVLTLLLATPVSAIDFFGQEDDSRESPKGPSLKQRVQMLERRINTLSNIVLRLDSLQQEMQQLRGDVELQNHALESMKKRHNDLYTDIDQRISRLTGEASDGWVICSPQLGVEPGPPSVQPASWHGTESKADVVCW